MKLVASTHADARRAGFTLAEVALTIGIVAGTALVVIGMIGTLSDNVRRLKEPEAKPRMVTDSQTGPSQNPLPDEGQPDDEEDNPPGEPSATPQDSR